jgi:N-acetylmuramoyl-L-alanine amidase
LPPPRLVVDFREVDFAALDRAPPARPAAVVALRAGRLAAGWSRLVLELDGPRRIATAEMRTATGGGGARVRIALAPATADAFARDAAAPDPAGWAMQRPAAVAPRQTRQRGDRPLVVVLDPGHGGIDPGAEHGGITEADLMLRFARELKEALVRAGGHTVVLTRDDDVFVSLDARIALAQSVGADLFVSLHADAVTEGVATGATVYTLADEASDAAAAALAERHDRDTILAGVDLRGQDDQVAAVLMDLARGQVAPRTDRLAEAMVASLRDSGIRLHRIPRRAAAFSVLRAPDIPSVLLELGYLTSSVDRRRLGDPEWRERLAQALVEAIAVWAVADAAEATLLRQ